MYHILQYLFSQLFGKRSNLQTVHVRRESFVDQQHDHYTDRQHSQNRNTARIMHYDDEEYKEEPI